MTRAIVAGIANSRIEDRGDGFVTVVPPHVATAAIIDRILKELPTALDRHNRTQRETARFQLRLAVTIGPVVTDIVGVSGEATIIVARLVEASDFKAALAGSSASLGLIVSPFVYEAVIRRGIDSAELETYKQILVEVKELTTTAWMKLVNHQSSSV
jgi:hypothetical protein